MLNETVHWKPRALYCLLGFNLFNFFKDFAQKETLSMIKSCFELTINDNLHMN